MRRVVRSAGHAALALLPARDDYAGVRRTWRGDVLAGITVGVVALPLALGFGVSSGAGADAGLVTAIVAGVLAAVFGGSNVQVSGPTGAMVVVLVPIVAQHGIPALAAVSVMAGVLVLAAGALRLGRAVSVIPWPVMEGFTLGIAVIIFCQQIPLLTSAVQAGVGGHSANAVVAAAQALSTAEWSYVPWALGAALLVAAAMLVAPRVHAAIPGSLLGIVLVTLIAVLLPTPLAPIGTMPSSLPLPQLPVLTTDLLIELAPAAFAVAALAAIESLLSARVAAGLADTGSFDPDRELVGQGIASIGAGLCGGMPATGAIARTAVNVRSGARSRLAAITHALVLLAVILVAAGPVGQIPLAALAGVLMLTAWRMIDRGAIPQILRSTRSDALAFVLTAVVTVAFDLIVAVALGVACASFFALRAMARSTSVQREAIRGEAHDGDDRIAIIAIDGPLMFAAAERVFDQVTRLQSVDVLILRMSQLDRLDTSGAHVVTDIVRTLESRGMTVLIKGVRADHAQVLTSVGALSALRDQRHLFADLDAAIAHARSHIARGRALA